MLSNYIYYNPNPKNKKTSDCVIRMLCRIYGFTWNESYDELSKIVHREYEMPSSNFIWETYLKQNGFSKVTLPPTCPDCYNVRSFALDHGYGPYVACTGSHVVAVIDGFYYDAWDSGDEVVSYYFERR